MRVRWTIPAAQDFYRIVRRIQQDSPSAADRVASLLYEGSSGLRDFPRRGREGRVEGTRELVFPGFPYVMIYEIEDQAVDILRIYHGAQDWP